MNSRRLVACLLVGSLLAGCATQNQPLSRYDRQAGYRLRNLHTNTLNSDSVFVVLSFSGGGTRAAAFAYGALEELAEAEIGIGGAKRRLLDEVDVISSVSGGSFTAAYYALYRDRLFSEFEATFLKKNVQCALGLRVLNPVNWFRLASPQFDRIDLAAEYYDELLFHQHTFNNLTDRGLRPFVVINATDMSLGSRFEFVQEQFDLMYSDLGRFPVARAVAASSAFPILLSPLTLKAFPSGREYKSPQWIKAALADPEANHRRFKLATIARSYENPAQRPYVHLLDGGLSDNIGLRGPAHSLLSTDVQDSVLSMINLRKARKVAIISVNAKAGTIPKWDKVRRAPGLLSVVSTVIGAPMQSYSFETVEYLAENIERLEQDERTLKDCRELLTKYCPDVPWPGGELPEVDFYDIELDFERITEGETREFLKRLGTNYALSDEAIDRLRMAARQLLRESATYNKLLADLQ